MLSKLSLRIIAPTVVVSATLLVLGAGAAWSVHTNQQETSRLLLLNVSKLRASSELEISIRSLRNRLREYIHTQDPDFLEAAAEAQLQVERWAETGATLDLSKEELDLVISIRREYHGFRQQLAELANAKVPPSRDAITPLLDRVSTELLVPAQRLLAIHEDLAKQSNAESQREANRTVFFLAVICICGAFVGLATGIVIAQSVNRSIFDLGVPLKDASGKLSEAMGVPAPNDPPGLKSMELELREISTRVSSVVERLQRSERAAIRAEQLAAVGQLGAGLAHELRNPLMSMKFLVQSTLARGDQDHLGETDLRVMDEEILRLERTIEMFLDFARPPQMRSQAVDLSAMIASAVTLVSHRARQQQVELHFAPLAMPVCIIGDSTQLRQVLLNLLVNALDATPTGGSIHITVRADVAPNGQATWVVSVSDSGRGLPLELAERIFEPFVSTKETGMGLGLSISKRIIEAHGGSISASQRHEGGACFAIALPKRYARHASFTQAV